MSGSDRSTPGPLARLEDRVTVTITAKIEKETAHYDTPLMADRDGKLSGGGSYAADRQSYVLDIAARNNEAKRRSYEISIIEFSDVRTRQVKKRHTRLISGVSPGHTHTGRIILLGQEVLDRFILESVEVRSDPFIERGQTYDLNMPVSAMTSWAKPSGMNCLPVLLTLLVLAGITAFQVLTTTFGVNF